MKISIVFDDFRDGAGNIAQLLALNLKKENEVSVILTNLHSEPRYNLDGIKISEVNLAASGKNKVFALFSMIKRMKKALKETKPDLIISFLDNVNTTVCLSRWFSKTPIIVSERSNPVVIFPKAPWDKLRRIAYKRANAVSVLFDAFCDFDGGRFSKKAVVTHNIVDKPSCVKENYSSDKIKFVTFGRLADIKRMDLMIEMFDKAQKQEPNMELHIYGDGQKKEMLQDMIKDKNLSEKVFLHGYCNEVHKTLIENDVYLMTSRQEGFPNSLGEAMAVGLPTISFECHEGILEMTENGKSGYVIEEGNITEFVNKMIFLAKNESVRKELGEKAKLIPQIYSSENFMKEWNDCISQVIKK